jgi:SAM-dependent methyltransferase
MRLAVRGSNPLERLALRIGMVPVPAAEAWGGMATSGVLVAAVRSGLTGRLAQGPATVDELVGRLELDPIVTRMVLDCLVSSGHVRRRAGLEAVPDAVSGAVPDGSASRTAARRAAPRADTYALTRSARRWLDPASRLSVANFIASTGDYLPWWHSLENVVRSGEPVAHHTLPPDDPYWRRYILGQLDLARLSAREVARKLRLPAHPKDLLDIGGGHGWYSAELVRRHPGLTATVLDLPGSAAIGREVIGAAGLSGRVRHQDGDAADADLGTGRDAVLCFNLIHHLAADQIVDLLGRIRDSLAPGGIIAILDAFADPARRRTANAAADYLSLFMYLSSGSEVYTPRQLGGWLAEAGFGEPRRVPVLRIPGLALYQAGKR